MGPALIAAVLAGCGTLVEPVTGLQGEWRWVSSTGGIAGETITPRTLGHELLYGFGPDTLRVARSDGAVQETGYRLERNPADGEPGLIRFDEPVLGPTLPGQTEQRLLRPAPDTLVLSDPCADCYSHTLARAR